MLTLVYAIVVLKEPNKQKQNNITKSKCDALHPKVLVSAFTSVFKRRPNRERLYIVMILLGLTMLRYGTEGKEYYQ